MTSILEKLVSIIAPHTCVSCSNESNIICDSCALTVFGDPCEICYLCNAPAKDGRVCLTCRKQTPLSYVWMVGRDDGALRRLLRAYKFERARAAHEPLATAMADRLPYFEDVIIVPIPTAPSRIRRRGYDHVALLARAIAGKKGFVYAQALRRRGRARQVGSGRVQRFAQAREAFEIKGTKALQGKHVIIVDDITTSGATLQAAADLVVRAGAARVDAIVAAKHTLESL